ncbi:sensor histidine kinase [Lacrimispora sp. 210928-DFI.3.58]|nr:sensor histidine kinase [Lacrimispora sp. 210928-DFI.3.58]
MEQDLRNQKEYVNRRTVFLLAGSLIFSVLFFGTAFFLCRDRAAGCFWAFMAVYVVTEAVFCFWYLKFLSAPLDHMILTVKKACQDEYKAQNLRTQAEVFALQSQINPHFLYNTLDTIRSYALLRDADDIAAMTESLSTLFRYSISRPGKMATLKEELDNVKNYLLIQQYRFPDKAEYMEEIEDQEILSYRMPILTIQPIVENAIHHGLEMKMGRGYVKVKAFRTESAIVLFITDNGLGMREETLERLRRRLDQQDEEEYFGAPEKKKKGSGIALLNVDKRLKFYYGNQYGLKVRSTLDVGTTVEINLPLEKKELERGTR